MNTASVKKYLDRHQINGELLSSHANSPDIIVVIPCYDEPDILMALNTLQQNAMAGFVVEVIVVVNSGEHTSDVVIEQNRSTYNLLIEESQSWQEGILLSPVLIENVRRKHAGVGYARKVGMDLAVWRFAQNNNTRGIIASLDADTKVASDYLSEIYESFTCHPKRYGVVVNFAHAISGEEYSSQIYKAIMHYELHLRYVNQALKMSGYPYVHHTVGSAFAVSASAYVAHGGMNRRQGGEDFYFLHKLFPHGEFHELNTTTVYPSSRPSLRVPFGTGPQVNEFLITQTLKTYSLSAFLELRTFIESVPMWYEGAVELSVCMQAFLESIAFEENLEIVRKNSASQVTFIKRFFAYFDAFKVVKFLNFSHQHYFQKNDVIMESQNFLKIMGYDVLVDVKDLLLTYRNIEGR